MANVTVEFTAKRRLVSGVTAGDIIMLSINLVDFDKSLDVGESRVTTIGGNDVHTLNYIHDRYSCRTGKVAPVQRPDVEMWLYSVMAGEVFAMTNVDEDRVMDCKLVGRWSRSRVDRLVLDRFRYQFTVREL